MIKKVLMGLGILFVVIMVIGVLSGGSKPTKTGDNNQKAQVASNQEPQQTEFKVGDVVKLGDRELIVNSATHTTTLGQFQQAKSGKEYVVVNVTIRNNGKDEVSYNPFDFKLKDSNGAQETYTFAVIDDDLKSGTLASGGKVTGSIPFEAPAGDKGLKLLFQPSFWSKDRIVVTL